MRSRPFPNDVPMRRALGRKGILREILNSERGLALVDFGDPDGPSELAFLPSFVFINPGDNVFCWWMNESGIWIIDPTV